MYYVPKNVITVGIHISYISYTISTFLHIMDILQK